MSVLIGGVSLPNPELFDSIQYIPGKIVKRTMADTYRVFKKRTQRKLFNLNFTGVERDSAIELQEYIETQLGQASPATYLDYNNVPWNVRFTSPTFEFQELGVGSLVAFSLSLEVTNV